MLWLDLAAKALLHPQETTITDTQCLENKTKQQRKPQHGFSCGTLTNKFPFPMPRLLTTAAWHNNTNTITTTRKGYTPWLPHLGIEPAASSAAAEPTAGPCPPLPHPAPGQRETAAALGVAGPAGWPLTGRTGCCLGSGWGWPHGEVVPAPREAGCSCPGCTGWSEWWWPWTPSAHERMLQAACIGSQFLGSHIMFL